MMDTAAAADAYDIIADAYDSASSEQTLEEK